MASPEPACHRLSLASMLPAQNKGLLRNRNGAETMRKGLILFD